VNFAYGDGDEQEIPFPCSPKERTARFLPVTFFVNGRYTFLMEDGEKTGIAEKLWPD
jgi:hypothetical protein